LPDGYLFTSQYQGGSPLTAMVGHAWDLDDLARSYEEFIQAFSTAVTPDPLARVIDLVHAWRRFPWIDPGLPARFLPVPWSGTAAAELFARRHAEWAGEAIAEWKQLLART
jgi:phenylacetic acid degradation operon negative regulatory protein